MLNFNAIGRVIFMLAILGCILFYYGRKILQYLKVIIKHVNSKVYISFYVVFIVMMISGTVSSVISMPTVIKIVLRNISSFIMGIFVYSLILFLITDIVLMIGKIFKLIPNPLSNKIYLVSGLIVIGLTLCINIYGAINGNFIKSKSYNVKISNDIDKKEENMNIVLISDIHIGAVNSEKRIASIVDKINGLKPDIVCIAGDIFDNDYNAIYNPQKVISELKKIKSTYGVYACLGNHDTGNTVGKMVDLLKKSDIKLLNEEYEIIDNRLILVGRLDSSLTYGKVDLYRENTSKLIKKIKNKEKKLPIVVMDHNPIHINEYGKNVDLILSGHTHRGQIFPGSLFTKNIYDVDYGCYQKKKGYPNVVVTSGVGMWGLSMRIGTDSEVINIRCEFN